MSKGMLRQGVWWWLERAPGAVCVLAILFAVALVLACRPGETPALSQDSTPPPEPSVVSPQGGALVSTRTPALRWSEVPDPSGVTYTLEIHPNKEFSGALLVKERLAEPRYALLPGEALQDGTYFWRVRAVDGAGNRGSWASSSVAVDSQPPAVPQLVSPKRGEPSANTTPKFAWSNVMDPSGVTYILEVHTNQDFNSPALVKTHLASTEYTVPAEGALKGGAYFWRVKAVDGAGNESTWTSRAFTVSTVPLAPYAGHAVEGRGDCLACHADLWPVPATHQGRTNDTCQICHQPLPGGPPKIAHPTEGRAQCDTCHAVAGLAPLPANHVARTVKMCSMCHQPSMVVSPKIAHNIEGRESCTACHGSGKLVALPVSHQGRTDAVCQLCHGEFVEPTRAPHPLEGLGPCTACHAEGKLKALPASHQGRTDQVCVVCHSARG